MFIFASGSQSIPEQDQNGLRELARDAGGTTGYLIEVKGYADSPGNACHEPEAEHGPGTGSGTFLIQNCNVPVRRVVAPGAMGTARPVATNETVQGRAQNRRLEVKVLMNRDLAGAGGIL